MKNDCPRCHQEPAIHDSAFGVLPGDNCQQRDLRYSLRGKRNPEFTSLARMSRAQRQRDKHLKDLIQPYDKNKPNPEFAAAYPARAKDYFTESELKRL